MEREKMEDIKSSNPLNQDEIQIYLKDIRKLKVMTPDREKFLAERIASNDCTEREKEQIQDIDAAVLRAWGNVEYQQFKFKDAVLKKGSGARWHVGLVAQRVKEAFEAEGVDPFAYGILCYDEWDEQQEVTEDGVGVVQEFQAAGNRYGIRYEEALALECAYLRSRLS